MRVVLVNYAHDSDLETAGALLERYRLLTGWAEGLASAGAEVVVAQGFRRDESVDRGPVRYELCAGRFAPRVAGWRIPGNLHRRVAALRPEVVHVNGLLFPVQTWSLRQSLGGSTVLVAQHHAERPWTGIRGQLQRLGLRAVDGFFFTASEQADAWRSGGLIARQPVFEISECSSRFRLADRHRSRSATGMHGRPIFFWAGNLDANKDPLTVLGGFELALRTTPEARLYLSYRGTELLEPVRQRIAASVPLASSVHLLGPLEHSVMEAHFNSADFFLQGSHYEGGACAVVEAMACGVVPLVTDIPTMRALTNRGEVGALWRPGDPGSLAHAIERALAGPLEDARRASRRAFEARLSFQAVGQLALESYRALRHR